MIPPICNASSEENGMELANILSEWLIIPRKGRGGEDPGELKSKTFPGEACSVPPTHLPPRGVRLGRSFRKSVSIYPTSALRHLNQGPWVMVQCQENLWILIFSRLSHQIAASLLWRSHFTTYNILNVRKTLHSEWFWFIVVLSSRGFTKQGVKKFLK